MQLSEHVGPKDELKQVGNCTENSQNRCVRTITSFKNIQMLVQKQLHSYVNVHEWKIYYKYVY